MMTNTGKTKADVILELVMSLNKGNSGYVDERARYAREQYDALVKNGIIEEVECCQEEKFNTEADINKLFRPPVETKYL